MVIELNTVIDLNRHPLPYKRLLSYKRPLYTIKIVLDAPF